MQTAVDTGSHIITNIEAHHADKRDSECLGQVLENTTNLAAHHLVVEEIAADTGYSSGKTLQACKDNSIIAYIPNCGQYKADRPGFIYNKDGNYYQCE